MSNLLEPGIEYTFDLATDPAEQRVIGKFVCYEKVGDNSFIKINSSGYPILLNPKEVTIIGRYRDACKLKQDQDCV